MNNPTTIKQNMRLQKWIAEVEAYKSRPADMTGTEWLELHGINRGTFYSHLHKVQAHYLDSLEQVVETPTAETSHAIVTQPAFVELSPAASSIPATASSGVAAIQCGNARIEISEDISEQFLLKLIEVASHAK